MRKIDIAVVDYGMGNLRSVSKALEHVAPAKSVLVTSCPDEIANAERVVFPGQGAMPDCIHSTPVVCVSQSYSQPTISLLWEYVLVYKCYSNILKKGTQQAWAFLRGQVKRFAAADMHDEHGEKLKVPHGLEPGLQVNDSENATHALWQGIESGTRFYYVHSYYVAPGSQSRGALVGAAVMGFIFWIKSRNKFFTSVMLAAAIGSRTFKSVTGVLGTETVLLIPIF